MRSMAVALAVCLAPGRAFADADGGVDTPKAIAALGGSLVPVGGESPVEVGAGVFLPQGLAEQVAGKVAAYDAAPKADGSGNATFWVVAVVVAAAFGGGIALGYVAHSPPKQ